MPSRMTFALFALFGLSVVIALFVRQTPHPTTRCSITVCALPAGE